MKINVTEYLDETVLLYGNSIAIEDDKGELSFIQLQQYAYKVADSLLDLQLSNTGTEGNEVDGTEGSWTLQEGDENLFVINRITGKQFKIRLEEV